MTTATPPTLDSTQLSTALRAAAPQSYDAALRGLRLGAWGLLALLIGALAVFSAPLRIPVLGLFLSALAIPALAVIWYRGRLIGRRLLCVTLALCAVLLLLSAGLLASQQIWWGALALVCVDIAGSLAVRQLLRAWRALGPLQAMLNIGTLLGVAHGLN